ncbi:MAG: crossover junction endodeoxyribonuclease RuvC, partial [Gammaproteobacteria bacterium]|nr:crossover junction endodeoxyribonuclease RuvC [Gammaproteobacteria bacterium]
MSNPQSIILGVDPGFHITGYAILKKDSNKAFLLDCGYLKMRSTDSLIIRTGQFHTFFTEKIKHFLVTEVALETSFLGKNAQTFLKLGYLRGILYLLANTHSLGLHEFAPREIKAAVVGNGGASKDQVAAMIIRMFPKINEIGEFARNDVSDALAISLCGFWRGQLTVLQKLQE